MTLSAEDRVALILGRAIIRAEALQAQLDVIKAEQQNATHDLLDDAETAARNPR